MNFEPHTGIFELPKVQTYITHMVDAARLGWSMTGSKTHTPDFTELHRYLIDNLAMATDARAGKVRQLLQGFGTHYLANHPGTAVRACHAVSHGFRHTWAQNPLSELFPLQITIGAVRVRGQNVFDVTIESVKRTVENGYRKGQTVDVHVWLTLPDLTVLDLTLLSTLRARGDAIDHQSAVLVWHPSNAGIFDYEPLMLDNDFYDRVERTSLIEVPLSKR